MDFNRFFNSPIYWASGCKRFKTGKINMRVVFDRSIVEIFADGGAYANSTLMFPEAPYERLILKDARAVIADLEENDD